MIYKPTLGQIAAGGYRNHPRYRACVGHWPFIEGGGLKTFDISGYRKDGTLTSGPAWTRGRFGHAIQFDGVNSYVNMSDPNVTEGLSELSIAAWAQSNILTTEGGRGLVYQAGTIGIIWNSTEEMKFQLTTAGLVEANANADLVDTELHHYVGVYTGANALLYVDGILQTDQPAQTGATPATSGNFMVGSYAADRTWDGTIEEVRIYQRALTETEVRSLYTHPFLEFQQAPSRRFFFLEVPPPPLLPAGGLGLLGVGR